MNLKVHIFIRWFYIKILLHVISMNVVIQNQINQNAMRLEVLTCEHCNLKCRYCARYSCIAKPRFYELEQFKQDILDLKKTNIKIASLTFSGGEPLMNPNLIKMIEFARSQLHDTSLVILTNGIILSSKPLEYFKTLSYLKVLKNSSGKQIPNIMC